MHKITRQTETNRATCVEIAQVTGRRRLVGHVGELERFLRSRQANPRDNHKVCGPKNRHNGDLESPLLHSL